jgi:translation elongation factor EF-4
LQAADVPATIEQMKQEFDFKEEEIIFISAKNGTNVDQVF